MVDKCPECGIELRQQSDDPTPIRIEADDGVDHTRVVCLCRQLQQKDEQLAKAKAEIERLRHVVDSDWLCDACQKWFGSMEPNHGHECNLCPGCAAEPAKEKP